jgi:hypothetical protein
MAQIFPPAFNTFSRVSIFGAVFFLAGGLWTWSLLLRSPYTTQANVVREQPVPFSHEHHVSGLGIDCRYCHTSVEAAAFAGIPATKVCMSCHGEIWKEARILEPVRASWRDDRSIEWMRVHDLPDFVYFDHSIHLAKGVGCSSCHGDVAKMPLMWRTSSLDMEWCLDCHRDPVAQVRPREFLFDTSFDPATQSWAEREHLAAAYGIQSRTSCSTCHR